MTEPDEGGLFDYAWVLLQHWRLVVGTPLVAALVTIVLVLVLPRQWEATAEFVPESSSAMRLPSGLGSLAGQIGLSIGETKPLESPAFYVAVASSRPVLEAALQSKFPISTRRDSTLLLDALRVREGPARRRLERGIKRLKKSIHVVSDTKTGILKLSVETRDSTLSAAVANFLVEQINQFNRSTRTLQARERRKFAEERTNDAERDLTRAEETLRTFLTHNRTFSSPELNFERARLERQVQIRQEVYETVRREFETARIEEVNDTPVLTVIAAAVPPATPSFPQRLRMTLAAAILGLVLGVGFAFLAEYFRKTRLYRPAAYDRVVDVWGRRGGSRTSHSATS